MAWGRQPRPEHEILSKVRQGPSYPAWLCTHAHAQRMQPVLVAAAVDYEMVNGRRHGDLATHIADEIKK